MCVCIGDVDVSTSLEVRTRKMDYFFFCPLNTASKCLVSDLYLQVIQSAEVGTNTHQISVDCEGFLTGYYL